jgi:hypothetical protein
MEPNENHGTENVNPSPAQQVRIIKDEIPIYYSNCAMVSTSPMDLSLFFGRYNPVNKENGEQVLAECYDKQIIVTFEQARNLARAIVQTLQMVDSARQAAIMEAQAQNAQAQIAASKQTEAPAMLMKEDLELEVEIPIEDQSEPIRPYVHSAQPRPQMNLAGPNPVEKINT